MSLTGRTRRAAPRSPISPTRGAPASSWSNGDPCHSNRFGNQSAWSGACQTRQDRSYPFVPAKAGTQGSRPRIRSKRPLDSSPGLTRGLRGNERMRVVDQLCTFFQTRPSLLRLLEISQIRRRLVLLGGHQQAVRAEEIVFLADD